MKIDILCPEGHVVSVDAGRLGSTVLCPHCYAHFVASVPITTSLHARAEKGKARPSRDDDDDDDDDDEDDDDDDDEPPRKKSKASPTKKPARKAEEEKSRGGKPARSRAKEEDDDDDEDDDEEVEEEEPIQWTKTKRQLNICNSGLVFMLVACYMICTFAALTGLSITIYQLDDLLGDMRSDAWFLFRWVAIPLLYLTTITLMVGMFISLAVPPKAEARGPLIAGLVAALVVLLLGVVILLTLLDTFSLDPLRLERMMQLLVGGSIVFFIICLLSAMGYVSKLLIFMRMHLEKSVPPTTMGFVLLALVILLVLSILTATLRSSLGSWVSYVIALVGSLAGDFAAYMVVSVVKLINRLRKTIVVFIKT